MAMYVPITTTSVTPMVSVVLPYTAVQGVGITYQQFLNSLGKYDYGVDFFYMSAQNYQQIFQPWFYNHTDVNGNQQSVQLVMAVDPYQLQPSIFYETLPQEVIFDSQSTVTFSLLNQSTVYLKMYCTIEYVSGPMDEKRSDNFADVEDAEGVGFFDDFCSYIIDEEA